MPPSKLIFALFSADEMRHPYDSAVAAFGGRIRWVPTWEALLEQEPVAPPATILVDLDLLPKPWDSPLETLRSTFPRSDLVGLCSDDSAGAALKCLRAGFSDYLPKPVSPEEIAWSLRQSQQRQEILNRVEGPHARLIRALTQISSSTSPWLLRHCTLEFLQSTLHSEGALWLDTDRKLVCGLPRRVQQSDLARIFPRKADWSKGKRPRVFRSKSTRKAFLPSPTNGILLWGITERVSPKRLAEAKMLFEHAQVCLLNLEKFEEVKQRTFIDDLTGLYNSRYLKHALTNAMVRSSENARHFAVLFIDVDRFKRVNDAYGHLVGSAFLVAIAKAVRACVRNIDPVFRYGGDEFVVILHDTTKEGAKEIGERIRRQIERRLFVVHEHRIQTTVSVGIAVYPDHTMEGDTLLRLADHAMYSVKRESRNAVHMAFPEEKPKDLNS